MSGNEVEEEAASQLEKGKKETWDVFFLHKILHQRVLLVVKVHCLIFKRGKNGNFQSLRFQYSTQRKVTYHFTCAIAKIAIETIIIYKTKKYRSITQLIFLMIMLFIFSSINIKRVRGFFDATIFDVLFFDRCYRLFWYDFSILIKKCAKALKSILGFELSF